MAKNFLSQLTGSFAMPAAENPTVAMVEAAYKHHGLDWRYINCEVLPKDLGDAVKGARAMGWNEVALLCGHEMEVPGALTGVVRIMLVVNTDKRPDEIQHVYLGEARQLRPQFSRDGGAASGRV